MNAKKQNHRQSREQMVDQNFANNTLFMTLSDIEAIEQKYLYTSSKPKQFGMYDPVDYSHREVDVLKEQLRLKLFLTNTSMQCFRQDYGTGQYRLPQSFNEEMVLQRLNGFQKTFQKKQDEDCFQMCEDLKKMMQGQSSGFYFETKQFKTAAAVSQKENTMGLINASSRMREEQAQFESKYRDGMQAHEIEFKHNQQFQKTPAV